jgi:hypothetical protein
MPLGKFPIAGTTIDTASNPDDTAIHAAPGKRQRTYIKSGRINVTTAASTQYIIEDGVGGNVLFVADGSAVGSHPITVDDPDGVPLTENTLLNITNVGATGGVATFSGVIEVRGG